MEKKIEKLALSLVNEGGKRDFFRAKEYLKKHKSGFTITNTYVLQYILAYFIKNEIEVKK